MAASPGKTLFGKDLSCAVSVVRAVMFKMEPLQVVYREEISVCFMATNGPFSKLANRFVTFRLSVSFEEMILPCLNGILVVFCKSNYR